MGSFLILLGLTLTVLIIIESYNQYRKNNERLSQAKYAHYCATADDIAYADYSVEVDLRNKHITEIIMVGAIAAMMGYGVIASYHEFISTPQPQDKSMLWFFVVIWLFLVALFWRTLLSLRDLFRERALYMQSSGKEIALKTASYLILNPDST